MRTVKGLSGLGIALVLASVLAGCTGAGGVPETPSQAMPTAAPTQGPTTTPEPTPEPTPRLLASRTNVDAAQPFDVHAEEVRVDVLEDCGQGVAGFLKPLDGDKSKWVSLDEKAGSGTYKVTPSTYSIWVLAGTGCSTWAVSVYEDGGTPLPSIREVASRTDREEARPFDISAKKVRVDVLEDCGQGVAGFLKPLNGSKSDWVRLIEKRGSATYDVQPGTYSIWVLEGSGCPNWSITVFESP